MTQHIEEARKLESVAWGAWSDFEQKVIAATTDKMKADTYDGQGDISIHPLVRLADAQAAIAAAEERGRSEERERARQELSPADVFRVIKRYKNNGRFDWDFVSQMCRDIAAITKEPTP